MTRIRQEQRQRLSEPRMDADPRGSLRGGVGLPAPGPEGVGGCGGGASRAGARRCTGGEGAPRAPRRVARPRPQKNKRLPGPGAPSPAPVAIDPRHPRSSAAQLPLPLSAAIRGLTRGSVAASGPRHEWSCTTALRGAFFAVHPRPRRGNPARCGSVCSVAAVRLPHPRRRFPLGAHDADQKA